MMLGALVLPLLAAERSEGMTAGDFVILSAAKDLWRTSGESPAPVSLIYFSIERICFSGSDIFENLVSSPAFG